MLTTFNKSAKPKINKESFVPASILAASVPLLPDADPIQVAYNNACHGLDSERVCLIYSVDHKMVHYLAGVASEFTSAPLHSTTALALAMPGIAGHRGDGAYIQVTRSGMSACVICRERRLYSFAGYDSQVARFPETVGAADLPIYRLSVEDDLDLLPAWKTHTEHERADSKAMANKLIAMGVVVNIAMGLTWVGGSIAAGLMEDSMARNLERERTQLAAVAGDIAVARHKHPAWDEYSKVAAFVMQKGGELKSFSLKGGKVTWRASLPLYVTGADISAALGQAVSITEESTALIIARN